MGLFRSQSQATMTDLEKDSRTLAWDAVFFSLLYNLTMPYFGLFAKEIGANDYQQSLITSLSQISAMVAMIPASLWIGTRGNLRKTQSVLALICGALFPVIAMVPYFGSFKVWIYLLLVGLTNLPWALYTIGMQSFYPTMFGGELRGAFSQRTRYATAYGNVALLISGILLQFLPQWIYPFDKAQMSILRQMLYQVFFASALLFSLFQYVCYRRLRTYQPRPQNSKVSWKQLGETTRQLLAYKRFKVFLWVAIFFHIVWYFGMTQLFVYLINYRNCNEFSYSLFNLAIGLGSMLTFKFWTQKMQDWGGAKVLGIGMLGIALNPLLMMLCPTQIYMVAWQFVFGMFNAAFTLALYDQLISNLPPQIVNRPLAISVYSTAVSVVAAIFPIVGIWVSRLFLQAIPDNASLAFSLAIGVSSLLRLFGAAGTLFLKKDKTTT